MKALRNQYRLRMATIAAALFVPLHASAMPPGVAMTESDLGCVSAQGLTEVVLRQAMHTSKNDDARVLGKLSSTLHKQLRFLDVETSMKDVAYDPVESTSIVNPDGSITQILPTAIGELRFDRLRIKGDKTGPGFGSISMKGIDLRGTTLTLSPRR